MRAAIDVPGRVFEAEQLWYDTSRWPSFVDGMHHLDRVDPGWPREEGAKLTWVSNPGGRGRVVEVVEAFEARSHLTCWVEDEEMRGTQTLRFTARGDAVRVELELAYSIKRERGWTPAVDFVFVRRPMREALQRTLRRFARELRADREIAG